MKNRFIWILESLAWFDPDQDIYLTLDRPETRWLPAAPMELIWYGVDE